MPSMFPDNIILFLMASVFLSFSPGPDNIYVFSHSLTQGKKTGLLITLGLCIGLLFHVSMVLLGISVLIKTSPLAYSTLKIIGACYLLYIAWNFFSNAKDSVVFEKSEISDNNLILVKKGIILNITNPKVAIFFLAFFPQFTNPDAGSINTQILFLGFLFIGVVFIVFGGISIAADLLGRKLINLPRTISKLNYITAIIFAVLAVHIIIGETMQIKY